MIEELLANFQYADDAAALDMFRSAIIKEFLTLQQQIEEDDKVLVTTRNMYAETLAKFKQQIETSNKVVQKLLSKTTKLQQQIEDMKCCGNCNGSYTTPNDACFCARYLKPTNAGYYCKAWQSDGQTRKEREI